MLDEMVIMERILNMSPEERRRVMQKALDDSHITCMDGPGAVVFTVLRLRRQLESRFWRRTIARVITACAVLVGATRGVAMDKKK